MKKAFPFAVALLAITAGAQAGTFFDQARVRSVEPRYESVAVPRQECTQSWVSEAYPAPQTRDYSGAVIGGIAGALLGNQVGGGHGRQAATAVGAVVGAMTGDNIANRGQTYGYQPYGYQPAQREVTSCRTVQDMRQEITGYRVEYEYRGQVYSTFMREQPGPALRVRVSVDPA